MAPKPDATPVASGSRTSRPPGGSTTSTSTLQRSIDAALMRDLATCRYADDATNVLFIGPPGVGKTMLAITIALGHAAVDAGIRTYYTAAADLAARCRRAAIEGRWPTTMRFFNGPGVLIIVNRLPELPGIGGQLAAARAG